MTDDICENSRARKQIASFGKNYGTTLWNI